MSPNALTVRVLDVLRRHRVLTSWASVGRVTAWIVVWTLMLSFASSRLVADAPEREVVADVPPSNVFYVAPTSLADFAGFLPPPDDPDVFTIAWIGGSEIKLNTVSVPAAFQRRVPNIGDRPVRTVVYSLVANRIGDVVRAADTAAASGADAVIVALNPSWTRADFIRGWDNLDVSNLGTFWKRTGTLPWAAATTGPDDIAWRVSRAVFGVVDDQVQWSQWLDERLDVLDVIQDPPTDQIEPPEIDPRLPRESDTYWLVREHGTDIVDDVHLRVIAQLRGSGIDRDVVDPLVDAFFDELASASVPVYAYASSLNPADLADPEFDAELVAVEAFWADRATSLPDRIAIESRMWSRDDPAAAAAFGDIIHFIDPEPFTAHLAEAFCAHLTSVDPTLECP